MKIFREKKFVVCKLNMNLSLEQSLKLKQYGGNLTQAYNIKKTAAKVTVALK